MISIGSYYLYSLKADSAYGRLFIWEVSLTMIKDNPVMGIGIDRYAAEYNNWQAHYFMQNPGQDRKEKVADNIQVAYNEYLQGMVEVGVVGFLLFFGLITFTLFYSGYSLKKINKINGINTPLLMLFLSCFASFISMIVMGIVSYPFHGIFMQILFIMNFAVLSSKGIHQINTEKYFSNKMYLRKKIDKFSKVIIGVLLIGLSIIAFYKLHKIPFYKEWQLAINNYNNNNYLGAQAIYNKLYPQLCDDGFFLLYYGTTLAINEQYDKSISILEQAKKYINDPILYTTMGNCYRQKKEYIQAEECYKYAKYMVPNRLYPIYLMALLFEEQKKYTETRRYAQIILESQPKIQSEAIDEMKLQMEDLLQRINDLP